MGNIEKISAACCYCEKLGFRFNEVYDVLLFCKNNEDSEKCAESKLFTNKLKREMRGVDDYNYYSYTVNTYINSEPVQLHGEIWAISDYAALSRILEIGIVKKHEGHEFLSIVDINNPLHWVTDWGI